MGSIRGLIAGLRRRLAPRQEAAAEPVAPLIATPVHETHPSRIENDILVGRDGWLFLWGGNNAAHRFYTDRGYFTGAQVRDWAALLARREDRLAAVGTRYLHLVVPDKISLYPERITARMPCFDRHPAAALARSLAGRGLPYLDLLPVLGGPEKDANFFLTDSHWRHPGCLAAYRAVLAALGLSEAEQDFSDRRRGSRDMALDLGGKLDPPVLELAEFVPVLSRAQRVHANHLIRYNESRGFAEGSPHFVGCQAVYRNSAPDACPMRVVVFGDSYSEFRPHLLTAMLAETFAELHFVWSTSLDHDYIARVAPDIVITEIAERFCIRLPDDAFVVDERAELPAVDDVAARGTEAV